MTILHSSVLSAKPLSHITIPTNSDGHHCYPKLVQPPYIPRPPGSSSMIGCPRSYWAIPHQPRNGVPLSSLSSPSDPTATYLEPHLFSTDCSTQENIKSVRDHLFSLISYEETELSGLSHHDGEIIIQVRKHAQISRLPFNSGISSALLQSLTRVMKQVRNLLCI
ncbi:hypothetical protein L218DRAFT_968277 [Marasmius fiardii PR-910]|nr:hypothetical protein L218DRAFT_968277 [Marasmius fiardii PR-910]